MALTNVPYAELVRLVADGESVSASVTNRASQDLAQRTQFLRETIAGLSTGQSIRHAGVALQAGMPVGAPVYLDGDTYKPSVAGPASGGAPAASSIVAGIVAAKTTDTSGDVILAGVAVLGDITSAIDDATATPGAYYVSATTPGKLSRTRSASAVFVGTLSSTGVFIVAPRPPSYIDHEHELYTLVGSPAGTVVDPSIGGVHTVNSPNPASRGWLPATPTYFTGWVVGVQIPANAKFGYNLTHASDSALAGAFPPIPTSGAVAAQAGLTVTPSPLLINEYGIWWIDDSYGNAPWPIDYSVTSTASSIQLWLTKSTPTGGATGVTALTADSTSVVPLQILDQSGNAASGGAVKIKIPALLTTASTTDNSHLAVKSISGNTANLGPVAARIKAGANVSITATHGDGTNGYYGVVTVAASASALAKDGVLAYSGGAVSQVINDIGFSVLPAGVAASPVWNLDVSEVTGTVTVTPIIWIYTGATATLPATFTYRYKIVTPLVGGTAISAISWSSAAAVSALAATSGNVYTVSLPGIAAVPAGSRVLLNLARTASDAYAGLVGIMRVAYTAA